MLVSNMFSKPIEDGVLTRSILIKGLTNMIYKRIENYFCFTELTLDNLNLVNILIIGDYVSLKKLILRHNSIKDLSALSGLDELEYLDVSDNCLDGFSNFTPPKMLIRADFSRNNINHMDDLINFRSLVYLDLSHNIIENVDGIRELKYLKFLNLSHNFIEQVNYSLPRSLVEINLSHNRLERIQLDLSSSECEMLNVSHNKLKQLKFLKNTKRLSVLNIQNNMIDDVLQIEYLKPLINLRVLNAENNKFTKINIHEQIFSDNLPLKSIIDQTFMKTDELQDLTKMEVYSMLMAKKSAIKSTVLEHLSGRLLDIGNSCESQSYGSLPMVILVGPPKIGKKQFLNQIYKNHQDKFYQAFIHTTNNTCTNEMFKIIADSEFNRMNCAGKFVFSYRFLGYSYALCEDQLSKCKTNSKILITFTSLEGALCLKLKGYNPIFVLLLPKDKLSYKKQIYSSMEPYMNQNYCLLPENDNVLEKQQDKNTLNAKDIHISNSNEFNVKPFSICSTDFKNNSDNETNINVSNSKVFEDDSTDPCTVYVNECMNNLIVCYNLYEKSTAIFHSLVYTDNSKSALNEILTTMVDVYNTYQIKGRKKSENQKQLNKHMLEYVETHHKLLYNELAN